MLSLVSATTAYAGAAPLARPAASGIQMMAKSRSLPWTEAPAHLQGMVGNADFDPWGLSTPQNIKWMREAELKHGRMAQLAWAGWVAVDLGIKFPGARYADLSSYKAALIQPGKSLLDQSVGYEMLLLFLWVGTFETIGFTQIYNMMEGDDERAPGDFGFDPLGLLPGNEEQYKTAELTHGRAAMLAFSAVVTQSALPATFGVGKEGFPYF